MPGSVHSGSANWDNYGRMFPDKLCVSSFPDRFPRYALWHSQPTHWVKGARVLRYNLPSALLAEWLGSFMCHCGNMRVKWTPNKSKHTKLTLDKKILPLLLPGSNSQPFNQVQRSYQQAILALKKLELPACHQMYLATCSEWCLCFAVVAAAW